MKNVLTTALAVLAAIVLAAGAVCIGAVNGWKSEREEALSVGETNAELTGLLETRAMDAANLAVVASRHLPEDDKQLALLRDAQSVLRKGTGSMQELISADALITEIAAAFGKSLPVLPSVQASQRDQVYISMLTRTLSEGESAAALFRLSADDFNARLNASLTGRLARLLGVEPITND